MKQEKISKGLALGVFCLQVVCLISSCCLKSMKWVPRDEFEEEDEVYNRSQPLLHVSSPTHAEQRKDPWSERMMQRYGLDTRDFSYQPESQNQNVERPKKGRCAIMWGYSGCSFTFVNIILLRVLQIPIRNHIGTSCVFDHLFQTLFKYKEIKVN